MYDFAIIGGGIVGLATGAALGRRYPFARILLVEKEAGFAQHQTGRNSGVIHSGIYYKPGSLKAEMAQAGNQSMRAFCYEYGVPFEVCGKLIVATSPEGDSSARCALRSRVKERRAGDAAQSGRSKRSGTACFLHCRHSRSHDRYCGLPAGMPRVGARDTATGRRTEGRHGGARGL